jgi:hypothetical protein
VNLKELQTQDADGNPQILRATETLPVHFTQTGDRIELTSGWFSGCMPLGYMFIVIAIVHGWAAATTISYSGVTAGTILVCLIIIGELMMAAWMFSKRTKWQIDPQEIRRWRTLPFLKSPSRWSSETVQCVTIVEQGTFGYSQRFQMFAPGIILKTARRSVDLGAHGNETSVHEIGRAISDLLEVPLENKTRDGIFEVFRSSKVKLFLIALAIGGALIALRWWLESR